MAPWGPEGEALGGCKKLDKGEWPRHEQTGTSAQRTDMLRPEIISALALAVSILSLAVTVFMALRTIDAEKPFAWVEIEKTDKAGCWIAKIHLRNRSRFDLQGIKVIVPVRGVPITEKQDFFLVEYRRGFTTNADGTRILRDNFDGDSLSFIAMLDDYLPVKPGDTEVFRVLLVRTRLNNSSTVQIAVAVSTMKSRPKYTLLNITGHIPTEPWQSII